MNRSYTMRIIGLTFLLFFSSFSITAKENSFRKYHEKSKEYTPSSIDQEKAVNTDSLIVNFMRCLKWGTTESQQFTQLAVMQMEKENISIQQLAALQYTMALALVDHDPVKSDSLANKAYWYYKDNEDVEGQVFSTFLIIHNNNNTTFNEISENVLGLYQEILEVKSQTEYYPAQLVGYLSELELKYEKFFKRIKLKRDPDRKYQMFYDNKLSLDSALNSFKIWVEPYEKDYYYYECLIKFSQAYQIRKEFKIAAYVDSLVVAERDPNSYHYADHQGSLALAYLQLGKYDKALELLKEAIQQVGEPNNAYAFNLSMNLNYLLSSVNFGLENYTAAREANLRTNQIAFELYRYALNQKRIKADKEFQLERKEFELQLEKERSTKAEQRILLLSCFLFILFILLGVIVYFFRQTKELNLQLGKLAKSREQLVKTVEHDLRSPIQLYYNLGDSIQYLIENQSWDRLKEVSHELKRTSINLSSLLSNIHHWEYHDSERLKEASEIDMLEVIEPIEEVYTLLAKEKSIELNVNLQDDGSLRMNRLDIAFVIRNLIDNAVKYSQEEKPIHMDCIVEKGGVIIRTQTYAIEQQLQRLEEIVELHNKKKMFKGLDGQSGLGWENISKIAFERKGKITLEKEGFKATLSVRL